MAKKTASKSATKKTASPKKKAASKTAKTTKKKKAGDKEVSVDRRRKARRTEEEAEAPAAPAAAEPKLERRKKVNRRRQIDPTTCERDYSDAEVEFMNALDEYKRTSGRMFPTCSEVLEVIRGLGYVQLSAAERAARASDDLESEVEMQANEALEESESLQLSEVEA